MTKIPSVEERVEEFEKLLDENEGITVGEDITPYVYDIITADRTALLNELRDCELLEERKKYPPDTFLGHRSEFNSGHNTLARAIKDHLDELIKSTQ